MWQVWHSSHDRLRPQFHQARHDPVHWLLYGNHWIYGSHERAPQHQKQGQGSTPISTRCTPGTFWGTSKPFETLYRNYRGGYPTSNLKCCLIFINASKHSSRICWRKLDMTSGLQTAGSLINLAGSSSISIWSQCNCWCSPFLGSSAERIYCWMLSASNHSSFLIPHFPPTTGSNWMSPCFRK